MSQLITTMSRYKTTMSQTLSSRAREALRDPSNKTILGLVANMDPTRQESHQRRGARAARMGRTER